MSDAEDRAVRKLVETAEDIVAFHDKRAGFCVVCGIRWPCLTNKALRRALQSFTDAGLTDD